MLRQFSVYAQHWCSNIRNSSKRHTHCHKHCVNLAVQDVVKAVPLLGP